MSTDGVIDENRRASTFLDIGGPFDDLLEGYQVREQQQKLCDAIEKMLEDDNVLAAEAGTGIGKTFAYLIPAILSGKKVVVSTGTRHLQDQIFHTDIPRVNEALDAQINCSILKGRSNYLCLHRLEIAPHAGYMSHETRAYLHDVRSWSKITTSGDVAELDIIPEESPIWPLITSTAENCLGGECEHWDRCHVVSARKQAQEADLLIINHHLLLADMALREEGFAELLPEVDAFIIDEAHQLHEVASRYFGLTISSRQLTMLAKDAIAEQVNDAPDMVEIRESAERLEKSIAQFRLSLGESNQRRAWKTICFKPALRSSLEDLILSLKELCANLEIAAERGRGLEKCYERAALLEQSLQSYQGENAGEESDEVKQILWFETFTRGFMLHSTPVELSDIFRSRTDSFSAAWLFTSATLQVDRDFSHFTQRIGLDDHDVGVWESPFDYQKQSMLYLPEDMPEPSDHSYIPTLIDKVTPIIRASGGSTFLLFTSYRAMHQAADLLKGKIPYPLLIQGDLPKHSLLEEFREHGDAVLLGTASFWEGVDVRGSALSCVVIDKLPFASPGDPVMQARIDAVKSAGGQPFMELQIPQAVIALKQGVGRLIRDVKDHGVVVIGDPRLRTKSYGQIFLNSLPPMKRTSDIDEVIDFYFGVTEGAKIEAVSS